jgi:hypothetical protein
LNGNKLTKRKTKSATLGEVQKPAPKRKLGQKLLTKKSPKITSKKELTLNEAVVADIVAAYLYAISAVDDNKDIKNLVLIHSPLIGKYQVVFTEEVNKR